MIGSLTKRALLVALLIAANNADRLLAQSIGPLSYSNFADSPFAGRAASGKFFVDDFSIAPTLFFHTISGIDVPYSKPSTPGAVFDSDVDWSGNSIVATGVCTASIPASCSVGLGIEFSATELGFLPQAVGIAVTSFGPVSLHALSMQTKISWRRCGQQRYFHRPPASISLPLRQRFYGAESSSGIARFVVYSSDGVMQADDLQYGQLIPEPSSLALAIIAICFASRLQRADLIKAQNKTSRPGASMHRWRSRRFGAPSYIHWPSPAQSLPTCHPAIVAHKLGADFNRHRRKVGVANKIPTCLSCSA